MQNIQLTKLFKDFDKLQKIYGDQNLDTIYGCGNIKNPRICFVFMNPTARNVAANKNWHGLKAPWIGTKNVWNMFYQLGLFNQDFINQINSKKSSDWDEEFAKYIYQNVSSSSIYITNLSKATQVDARPLPNEVFRRYIELFKKEIDSIRPNKIIAFGNQVSSILLGKNIKVSDYRKKHEKLGISGREYKIFPVYYPVGQGMRNIKIAKEDIQWIIKN